MWKRYQLFQPFSKRFVMDLLPPFKEITTPDTARPRGSALRPEAHVPESHFNKKAGLLPNSRCFAQARFKIQVLRFVSARPKLQVSTIRYHPKTASGLQTRATSRWPLCGDAAGSW